MLTPQQVQEQKFAKAVFGGYDMAAVDQFLNELSGDYVTLYKENAVLKSKLKVLVESIEEYRSVDESMRRTLMSAQKMANDMVEEATGKAGEIMRRASEEADARKIGILEELREEQARLNYAKMESARFIDAMRALIMNQGALLDAVPALEFEAPPAAVRDRCEEAVEVIEQAVGLIEEQEEQKAQDESKGAPETFEIDASVFEVQVSQDTDPKPRFNFVNLQFGSNFDLGKKEKK